jgi:hypothetical protein
MIFVSYKLIRDDKRGATARALSQGDTLHPEHQREDQSQRYCHPYSDVKYALFNLFEAFGQVLQVVCKRNDKMRGQAFVVFREVGEATAAKNNLHGYPIFGKPMVDIELTLENTVRSQTQQNSLIRRKVIALAYYTHLYYPSYSFT